MLLQRPGKATPANTELPAQHSPISPSHSVHITACVEPSRDGGSPPGTRRSAGSVTSAAPILTSHEAMMSAAQRLLSGRAEGCTHGRAAASTQHRGLLVLQTAKVRGSPALPPSLFNSVLRGLPQAPSRLSSMPGRQGQGKKAAAGDYQQARL